ncbi:MAG: tetratricopeptide repeat protein [Pyrinomonadaceae bacterium]|nr:tetratricopeptide repeat protein [Pyrinomonadaceae bacterium]
MRTVLSLTLLLVFAGHAAAQDCAENAEVVPPEMPDSVRAEYKKNVVDAAKKFAADQTADNMIWVGRRAAYLGEYLAAIEVFTEGIGLYADDARFYRHRGHRYITLRCFDDAIKDFEKAASLIKGKPDEVEPDGLPNAKNIPTSTLQSNIWYHLGLAYYLKGDFAKAEKAYQEAYLVSKNNDMRAATVYWYYMTVRRAGKKGDAAKVLGRFKTNVEVIENTDYLDLLKLNKGEVKAETLLAKISGDANTLGSASLAYGIGNYYLYNGDKTKAMEIFRKIVAGNQWASFGYIAAEAELAR